MMTRGEQIDYLAQQLTKCSEAQKNDASTKAQFTSFPNDGLFYEWVKDLKEQYLKEAPAKQKQPRPAMLDVPGPVDAGATPGYFLTNQTN